MSATPKIAVLLSTYNGEAFLAAQLDSLLAQEGVDVQVFARDDGSSDGTLGILKRYAGHWPDLAAPAQGANLGPAQSFMALLARAPGDFDYYAFCDQDDVWLPGKLARAARRLGEVGPGRPALYCSRVLCVDEALRPLGPKSIRGDASFEHLLFENIAFGTTVVINAAARSGIVARPPGQGMIMHDWWCALWTAAFGEIVRDEAAEILYRQHGGNVLGSSPSWLSEVTARWRHFRRDPRGFYPICGQARAFLELHGGDLRPTQRQAIEALLASARSPWSRLRFALSRRVVRGDLSPAARLLIALGFY